MNTSEGEVSMSKAFFWPMFKRAWDKAFTEEKIQSVFRKSGIWPTDGSHVLSMVICPTYPTLENTSGLRSPKSLKAIRRFYATYDKNPSADIVKKLFLTTLFLSAQVSILTYKNRGLYKAIDLQKKKNRQGVRLNLARQANKDIIDCWSPS